MERQVTWIESLKGIAICGVVMVHCGGIGTNEILNKMIVAGEYGVLLFFMISAYLGYLSFERYSGKYGINLKTSINWLLKKIIRLAPLYYLVLVVGIMAGGA